MLLAPRSNTIISDIFGIIQPSLGPSESIFYLIIIDCKWRALPTRCNNNILFNLILLIQSSKKYKVVSEFWHFIIELYDRAVHKMNEFMIKGRP